MIPLCRRGPLVVLAVVLLLAPGSAVAQEFDNDAGDDDADAGAVDHAPAGAVGAPQAVDGPAPHADVIPPQIAVPNPAVPNAAVPNAGVPPPTPQTAPNGPREHTPPPAPGQPPVAVGAPPQPANGSAKVLGRSFPSPVQPPPPAEPPEVHVTIVPPSEPRVGKSRLRGDAGGEAPGGSDQPAAGVAPDSSAD